MLQSVLVSPVSQLTNKDEMKWSYWSSWWSCRSSLSWRPWVTLMFVHRHKHRMNEERHNRLNEPRNTPEEQNHDMYVSVTSMRTGFLDLHENSIFYIYTDHFVLGNIHGFHSHTDTGTQTYIWRNALCAGKQLSNKS